MKSADILVDEYELIDDFVKNGSHQSANILIRKHQNMVYLTALRYLKNIHYAEDLTQDVMVKAIKNLSSFKKNSSFSTWLYTITVNSAKNALKKKKLLSYFSFNDYVEDFYNIPVNEINGHQKLENEEFNLQFYKALDKLPEKQRETFALRYFEELPYEEISKLLGTSVGGLKANYFQAVKKLGVYLNEQ